MPPYWFKGCRLETADAVLATGSQTVIQKQILSHWLFGFFFFAFYQVLLKYICAHHLHIAYSCFRATQAIQPYTALMFAM